MDSNMEISYINKIEFGVFSNQEVKRYSVINDQYGINIPEAYDNKEPKKGGLIDKRLGVTDYNIACDTCGLLTNNCPGHFGHTELAEEVFHYGYLDLVKNIASCICINCSKILITKDREEMMETLKYSYGKNRFTKIKKLTSNIKHCQNPDNSCGKPVGKISKEITKGGSINIIVSYIVNNKLEEHVEGTVFVKKKKNIETLSPAKIYNIFKNINDDDCRLMGFDPNKTRPEFFIIKNFPIPPVAIRPSVRVDTLSSAPSEDGLTSKLSDIVKDNERLRRQKNKTIITGEESKYNNDYLQLLQYDVATYFDNESILPKSEQKGSKVSKSVSERLKGKTGRIRGNLMGKRVDFSARTVITSDPNLSIDELGVPIKIALNITIPEIVTIFNIDRLSKYVKNGRDIYPGANFVIPYDANDTEKKTKIDLRYRRKSIKLHYFDIVERHIIDNDYVLFNRQPSLHKMSMMCHKIKVFPDNSLNTFRINVTVTTPYNADFDGDEMNMFIPQSIQTQIEIKNIAEVKNQIISPRLSTPIIKFVQDTLLGTYYMTQKNDLIDYHDSMNLALYCNNIDIFSIKKEDITAKNLYSLIIPSMINYKDNNVEISNGNLISGIINKKVINDKIVFFSWDRYGPEVTKDFYDNAQRLITNWLLISGFSVGMGDAIIKKEVLEDIKGIIEIKLMETDKLITEMENNPETLDPDIFEKNLLSKFNASSGDIIKKIDDYMLNDNKYNNFFIMTNSGAKGSSLTLSQIIGGLGQKVLNFKRIVKRVNNRTLPHFFQNDDRGSARGYIANSYYRGLTPTEYFFEHQTAREGMIDTAIKSVTGDTSIYIMELGVSKIVNIGEWIDELLEKNKTKIKNIDDRQMELLELEHTVYIPTTDEKGNVSWGNIKNITRHDPGKELYEIITSSGRKVIVTESHSLLIWNITTQEFEKKSTTEVVLGDLVPVTIFLPKPPHENDVIDEIEALKIGLCIARNNNNKYDSNLLEIIIDYKYEYNYIKPEYFSCSNKIIIEILSGIFTGDSYLTKYSIQISTNNRLLEDINICLSRIGILGIINNNNLIISGEWFDIFNKYIKLITPDKYNNIESSNINSDTIYKNSNDVILDNITSINKIDITKYSKVYDLTIPSTYNFCLANGLHVVDTSDSGYLQRKLIKGMEDIMMAYDKTIRSSNNVVIQLLYGDNNCNQTFYKSIEISIIKMADKEIKDKFIFNEIEQKKLISEFKLDKNKFIEWNIELNKKLISMRDELRDIQMISKMNYIILTDIYKIPVNITRIIEDSINSDDKSVEKLNPLYIILSINYILSPDITKINLLPKDYDINSFKYKDQERAKFIFKIALFEYLNPKRCIYEYKLSKTKFDNIVLEIIQSFRKACTEPGEMVGVLTAQTLGEILTQMSVLKQTRVIILGINKKTKKYKIYIHKIGEFVDNLYKKFPDNINNIPLHNDSTEFNMDILEEKYYICGVKDSEITRWHNISHLSRHPTNGNLMEIKTYSSRTVTTTLSHNFLKRTKEGLIKPVRGDELKIGDRIPVARRVGFNINNDNLVVDGFELNLTENLGWFFGAYLAEGSINGNRIRITNIAPEYYKNVYEIGKYYDVDVKIREYKGEFGPSLDTSFIHKELADIIRNHFKCGSFEKVVPEFVHNTNINFIKGLLRGYMDGDRNIAADRNIIRVGSRSKQLIEDISLLFAYFGIFTSHYIEKRKNNDTPLYCIGISHKYARKYLEEIGTDFEYKRIGLLQIIEFSETYHHGDKEFLDMIPELGHIICRISKTLNMPGHSRCYGVFERKNLAVGRSTLIRYIEMFKERSIELDKFDIIKADLEYLDMITSGDVVWDKITKINVIEDPKEYVYDLTVPGNETFMLYNGIIVHNTLNSVAWNEKILYTSENGVECNVVNIGEMIDELIETKKENVIKIDNNTETEFLDIKELGYKVQSVDENGKMHWKTIEAVTKHLPGGNVVKVRTLSGKEVVATKAKSFLLRRDNKLVAVNGSDIKIGDRLPVQKKAPKLKKNLNYYEDIILNELSGYIFGVYIMTGEILENTIILKDENIKNIINFAEMYYIKYKVILKYSIKLLSPKLIKIIKDTCYNKLEKKIPNWAYIANKEFIKGILSGIYSNNPFTNQYKYLLSSIAELTTRDNFTLLDEDIIPGINIGNYKGDYDRKELEKICNIDKEINKLLENTLNEDVYYDPIIEILDIPLNEITPEHNKVYDLTVEDTRNFNILGGLCMRDTFHTSGVGVIGMQGIPRFREILSYSKKIQTPGMIVKLIPEVRNEEIIAHKIEAYLKHTILGKLIDNMEIIYDPLANNIIEKDYVNSNNIYYIGNSTINIMNLPWLYRLSISREAMLENDITLLDIKTKFIKFFEDYIDDTSINRKKVIISRIANGCIMSNYDNSPIPYIHIRLDVNNPDNYTLIEIGQHLINKISIKGISTIESVELVEKQKIIEYGIDNGIKENTFEWVLYMNGIDLNKLKTIKYIDYYRLDINDIHAVYVNFGIEAARSLIYIQTDKVYSGSGNSINDAHLLFLADVMTNTGNITSIDRHGINRLDTDPLSRASFEKVVEQLIMASAFGEVDRMRSVSSRIMAGRCFKGGTGLCEILMDNDMLENSEYNNQEKINLDTKNRLEENGLMKDLLEKKTISSNIWIPE